MSKIDRLCLLFLCLYTVHVFHNQSYLSPLSRLFSFSEAERSFHQIAETEFHDHCVLCVRFHVFDEALYLFSSATDGKLAMWNVKEDGGYNLSEPCFTVTLHQSGINALHSKNDEGRF